MLFFISNCRVWYPDLTSPGLSMINIAPPEEDWQLLKVVLWMNRAYVSEIGFFSYKIAPPWLIM